MASYRISGVVESKNTTASVAGYRLAIYYSVDIGGKSLPGALSARLEEDGQFELELVEDRGPVDFPIEVVVSTPDGTEQLRRNVSANQVKKPLKIQVTPPAPVPVVPNEDPSAGLNLRIVGTVVDRAGAAVPAGLPVIVSGTTNEVDTPVFVTATMKGGGFGADWVSTRFSDANAVVAGGEPVPVALDDDGRLSRAMLVVVDLAAIDTDVGDPPGAPPPLAASEDDLVANPEVFSQDLGGGCIDLTVPDRSLEEVSYFKAVRTTEPRISALTIETKTVVPAGLVSDLLGISMAAEALGFRSRSKTTASSENISLEAKTAYDLVRSDTPPSTFEIATNSWVNELDDTTTIIDSTLRTDVDRVRLNLDNAIDWDDDPTINLAVDLAFGHLLHFKQSFRSSGYSIGELLYSLPLAPGQKRQIAVLDWDRRTSSSRTEALEFEERLDAVVSRDRDITEMVNSSVSEDYEASSRSRSGSIAGGAGAGFIGSGFGIFAGVAGGYGESGSQSAQTASRSLAADSMQQLSDNVAQASSSMRDQRSTVVQSVAQGETVRAETEFVGNYNRCHSMTVEYFQVLRHFQIDHQLAAAQQCLFVPLPMAHFDDAKALRWREPLARRLRNRGLMGGFRAMQRIADDWIGWDVPEGSYSEASPEVVDGELRMSFVLPRPRDDEDGAYQVDMWESILPFIDVDPLELYTAKFNDQTQRARDVAFRNEVAPGMAASMVDGLRLAFVTTDGGEVDVPIDPTLVSRYAEGVPLYVTLNPTGYVPTVPRQDITHIKLSFDGVGSLPEGARVIVHSGKVRYSTDSLNAVFFDEERILDDLGIDDAVVVPAPLSPRELRNPREDDRELAAQLLAHLNDNLERYHHVIWGSLDAQRRFMLLDAVLVPGLNGTSVASIVENRIAGMVGNTLVMPVSPGVQLDPTLSNTDSDGEPLDLMDLYATDPPPPIRISVPTRGVHAEAVMGSCNACEEIDDTRYWRWTNDGTLALPGIDQIGTGSRATDEPNLTPTPLPAPIVSIQNAPAAPDPTGLAGAFSLLAQPDLFGDITGLEANQENAAAAMQSALSAASALSDQAYTLASQNQLGSNAQRLAGQLASAHDSGLVTDAVFGELSAALVSGVVGGVTPPSPGLLDDPDIAAAIGSASTGAVSANSPDGTSVEVEFGTEDEPDQPDEEADDAGEEAAESGTSEQGGTS